MQITVQAPSNIALIKYMGKSDSQKNLPANPSLSMTLKDLCTTVELSVTQATPSGFRWNSQLPEALQKKRTTDPQAPGFAPVSPQLKDRDFAKISRHMERVFQAVPEIFKEIGLEYRNWGGNPFDSHSWQMRTANTFPASSGIASSASSFAAITLATAAICARRPKEFYELWKKGGRDSQGLKLRRMLAQISRQGSGSSCRSFEGPWVYWERDEALSAPSNGMPEMAHFVILISTDPKKVSSSEAHLRIQTSPLWNGRVERVIQRTENLRAALVKGDLHQVAQMAWKEAWEMHSLFHTAEDPFSYWEPATIRGLQWFSQFFEGSEKLAPPISSPSFRTAPPIVTLDAGPNIHVIIEKSQREEWRQRLKQEFREFVILEDQQGIGADILELGVES